MDNFDIIRLITYRLCDNVFVDFDLFGLNYTKWMYWMFVVGILGIIILLGIEEK